MKLLIIGCGSIGERHLMNALALGCDVSVLEWDPTRVRLIRAAYPTVKVCREIAHDGRWDAALVCTPYEQHLKMAWEVLAFHRIPLFIEKPLGAIAEIGEWRELAADIVDLPTMVGYQLRWQRHAMALKAFMADRPRWVSCRVECDMRTWPGRTYGDGLLECSHEVDLAIWCDAGRVRASTRTETSAHILFERGEARLSWHAPAYRRYWSGGGAQWGFQRGFGAPEQLGDQMYVDELEHFLDCVRTGTQTNCPLSDGLRVLEVCQQVEQLAGQTA